MTVRQMMAGPSTFEAFTAGVAHDVYGSGDINKLFTEGSLLTMAPWPAAGRRKHEPLYDKAKVRSAMVNPDRSQISEVDPRDLRSTQPSITRAGVQYYLGDHYRHTGETYADQHNVGNQIPMVYSKRDGQHLLLSGHHRAAAALIKGERLQAIHVREDDDDQPAHAVRDAVAVHRRASGPVTGRRRPGLSGGPGGDPGGNGRGAARRGARGRTGGPEGTGGLPGPGERPAEVRQDRQPLSLPATFAEFAALAKVVEEPWQTHVHGDREQWLRRTEQDHASHLNAQRGDAERSTKGYMVSPEGRAAGITGEDFFKPGIRRSIERWGSDEMKDWHGSDNAARVGGASRFGKVPTLSEYRRTVRGEEQDAYHRHADAPAQAEPEHHDLNEGAAPWKPRQRVAGANGGLPEGYSMHVEENPKTERWGLPAVHVRIKHTVHGLNGSRSKEVGGLSVHQRSFDGGATVVGHPNVSVHPDHRRKGLATAMYAEVHRRWPDVPIVHSPDRSDDARALDQTLKDKFGPDRHQGSASRQRVAGATLMTFAEFLRSTVASVDDDRVHYVLLDHTDPEGAAAAIRSYASSPEQHTAATRQPESTEWSRAVMHETVKKHGFSFHDHVGDGPKNGYMVSTNKASEHTVPAMDFQAHHVADYRDLHQQDLVEPSHYVGGWVHKGRVFLDVSKHVPDRSEAMSLARQHRQLAIFNVAKGEEEKTEPEPPHVVKMAGAKGDLPDLHYQAHPPSGAIVNHTLEAWKPEHVGDWQGAHPADRNIYAGSSFDPGHRPVGSVSWHPQTGEIMGIYTDPEHKRRGVATELLRRAREVDPKVHHSDFLTDSGKAWSGKVASLPPTYAAFLRLAGRSEDIDDLGRSEHPNVTPYISGGIGHRDGDESRSVVGFLPTKLVRTYREHAGDWNDERSRQKVESIRADLRAGKGITNPVQMMYDHQAGWGYVGEGNHRVEAAHQEGMKTVPVRVYGRSRNDLQQKEGIGGPMHLNTDFTSQGGNADYVPPDIHPHHFTYPGGKTHSYDYAGDPRWQGHGKTAGANGDLPERLTFEHIRHRDWHEMQATTETGGEVGHLQWHSGADPMRAPRGYVMNIHVAPDYRRQGLGTELWRRAREVEPDLHHSTSLSDDGRAWAEHTASLPATYAEFTLLAAHTGNIEVAGIALVARDTGRVLMIQRSFKDKKDPARGTWEIPGGHLDEGEDPLAGARREFAEETGVEVPSFARVEGNWLSKRIYQGFLLSIGRESALDINLDGEDRGALNPDDPDHDDIEVCAWMLPSHLRRNPAVREEFRTGTDFDLLGKFESAKTAVGSNPFGPANNDPSLPHIMKDKVITHERIPLEHCLEGVKIDKAKARRYAQMDGDLPSIVALEKRGKYAVLEGNHRVEAARMRGDSHINGFVGRNPEPQTSTKKAAKAAALDTLKDIAEAGYNTDGWKRWQQGDCGTYAHALSTMKPGLKTGVVEDDEGRETHFFAHDDTHAYDSAGKHPLPYTGIHSSTGLTSYLNADLGDYGEPQGDDDEIAEAQQHARDHGILDGRYGLRAGKTAAKTLYRGEGDASRPSPYYPRTGPDSNLAGGWWTDSPQKAHDYSTTQPDGQVYQVDVEEHEYQPRGAAGNYFIEDPQVRARRTLHSGKTAHVLDPWTPSQRLFAPTQEGVDPILFDEQRRMRPQVRHEILTDVADCLKRHGLGNGDGWTRVYLAGSQASLWHGNRDFDLLVGVNFLEARETVQDFRGMSDQQVADALNVVFRDDFDDEDWHPGFDPGTAWHRTAYVNLHGWDIRQIKPYAAYDATRDLWAVEPVSEPTGHHFNETEFYYFEGVAAQVRSALALHEPQRTQRCSQIWSFIHTDRSRSFGQDGTGLFDRGNSLEKYLSQAPYGDTTLMDALAAVRYGKTASGLSDEGRISVAEQMMESHGHGGKTWHVPRMHVDDPAREEAERPVNDYVHHVLTSHGWNPEATLHGTDTTVQRRVRVQPAHWDLRQPGSGQANTDGANYIGLKGEHTNDLTLLHECAHVLTGTSEGQGHGPAFRETAQRLYHDHLSPEAGAMFEEYSQHPSKRKEAAAGALTWEHIVGQQGPDMYPQPHQIEDYVQRRTGHHPRDLHWSMEPYDVKDAYPDPEGMRSPSRIEEAARGYREHPQLMPPIIGLDVGGKREHVDGWHRLGGAEQEGMDTVPAFMGRVPAERKQAGLIPSDLERAEQVIRFHQLKGPSDGPGQFTFPQDSTGRADLADFVYDQADEHAARAALDAPAKHRVTWQHRNPGKTAAAAEHPDHPIDYKTTYEDGEGVVTARCQHCHPQGEPTGVLRWDITSDQPSVIDMSVDEAHRRQGIGTKMFNTARKHESGLQHSTVLSDEGREFARHTAALLPDTYAEFARL